MPYTVQHLCTQNCVHTESSRTCCMCLKIVFVLSTWLRLGSNFGKRLEAHQMGQLIKRPWPSGRPKTLESTGEVEVTFSGTGVGTVSCSSELSIAASSCSMAVMHFTIRLVLQNGFICCLLWRRCRRYKPKKKIERRF